MVKATTRSKKDSSSPTVATKATDAPAKAVDTKPANKAKAEKPVALDITLPSKPVRAAPKRVTRKAAPPPQEEPDKRPKRSAVEDLSQLDEADKENVTDNVVDNVADKENVAAANKKVTREPPKRQTKKRRVDPAPVAEEAAVEPDSAPAQHDEGPIVNVAIGVTSESEVKSVGAWMDQWKAEVLVIVAYTKANTPGCGKQCVAFSNANLPTKTAVVGLSLDSDESQTSFAEKKNLTFPLVHTGAAELAAASNCLTTTGKMVRSVVMVKRDGEVLYEKHKVAPEPCCVDAVKFLNDRANEVTEDEEAEAAKKPPPARKPAVRRKAKAAA